MLHGYTGNILQVDLSRAQIEIETPDEAFYRTYMGGSCLGLYYLWRLCPKGADPLGPDNVLTFALSAPTGVAISGQSRATATARSPISGGAGDSQAGGFWPAQLKFAGFDAIVIRGKAPKPVYLWIQDGTAELRDAGHLWGRMPGEVEAQIKSELGDDRIEVAQVGPGGERLIRFAAVMNMSNRAHGRTGMGAVMGSKNLKAIAVRGKTPPSVAHPDRIKALAALGAKAISENLGMEELGIDGTDGFLQYRAQADYLPSYNWRSGALGSWEAISGRRMSETILKDRDTCYACIIRCKRVVEVVDGPITVDSLYGGPEYETISTFGSYCGITDLTAIAKANELCNKYGVDTIACGATIAFAMDCFEHGILTTSDTDGIDLRFGNVEAMLEMLEMTLERRGLGDLLAEGSYRAAQKLGPMAMDLAVTVKGAELPAHMPQQKRSLALIYAVNPFGADHQSSEHDPAYTPGSSPIELERMAQIGLTKPQSPMDLGAEKVRFTLYSQYLYSALDSLDLCQFVFGGAWQLYDSNQVVELMQAVTGWEINLWELMKLGERRVNLMRAFNAREGIKSDHDTLPKKMFQPLEGGKSAGVAVNHTAFERALKTYYAMAGWDVEAGIPMRGKLHELDLGWVADELGL